jgi:hypothetical protein
MKEELLRYLITEYGDRIDYPQPLVNTDDEALNNQFKLLDKRLKQVTWSGFFWILFGMLSLMLNLAYLINTVEALRLFQLFAGMIFFASGVWNLNKVGDLRRKKAILEVIRFCINSK